MGKLRITLYGAEEESDRLVEAHTEFKKGPNKAHHGALRIDYLMENSEDVDGLIQYLQQLRGYIPAPQQKERKSSTSKNTPLDKNSIQTLINEAFTRCKTQEALIDYLRPLNFVFIDTQSLQDIATKNDWELDIKPKHEKYQWMIRQLKEAKNPMSNKYDPQVFFGIKIVGQKFPRVRVYQMGIYDDTHELHWKDEKGMNYKVKEKLYKFPEPMSYEERSRWRAEHKKVLNNPEYEPSQFFAKWLPYVKQLKPEEELKKVINKNRINS